MEIIVRVRDVYGVRKIYPVCDKAWQFAQIAGTKTLTPQAIEHIKAIGFRVIVEQPEIRL